MQAKVEISSKLTDSTLTVDELRKLHIGDILPIEMPETVTGVVEGIPVFKGVFGISDGHNAIKVTELISGGTSRKLAQVSGVQK